MSVSRDEFDRLAERVASLERQKQATIGLLSEQVMTIVPRLEQVTSETTIGLIEHMDERFASVDTKLDEIIRRLP